MNAPGGCAAGGVGCLYLGLDERFGVVNGGGMLPEFSNGERLRFVLALLVGYLMVFAAPVYLPRALLVLEGW